MKIYVSVSQCLFFTFIFCTCFTGCKNDTWPDPHFILKYDTNGHTYSKEAQYNSSASQAHDVTPLASVQSVVFAPDSILMKFSSTLIANDGGHEITISISKTFKRSQLDSTSTGYRIKNDDDFYNLFKAGQLSIASTAPADERWDGVDILIKDTLDYLFQPVMFAPPVPAWQDNANSFQIISSTTEINPLSIPDLPTNTSFRLVMVTFNFKCRLYGLSSLHDERIFANGTFQGYFIDK